MSKPLTVLILERPAHLRMWKKAAELLQTYFNWFKEVFGADVAGAPNFEDFYGAPDDFFTGKYGSWFDRKPFEPGKVRPVTTWLGSDLKPDVLITSLNMWSISGEEIITTFRERVGRSIVTALIVEFENTPEHPTLPVTKETLLRISSNGLVNFGQLILFPKGFAHSEDGFEAKFRENLRCFLCEAETRPSFH